MPRKRLGVGFIGSGFNARFHMLSWAGVRDADVLGVWSPNRKNAESAAAYARSLDIGACKAYRSIAEMVADPAIDAIWLSGPNQARIENFEELTDTVLRGRGELVGVACEKPLARNVAEAKRVTELVKKAGLMHGYLENQAFSPQVERGRELLWARGASLTGRPYLARAAEEHSGPHMPWFWQGKLQGGGAQRHECHPPWWYGTSPSRALLSTVKPVRHGAHRELKWSRPAYVPGSRRPWERTSITRWPRTSPA
jgi:predicted dehydrogenase